MSNHNPRHKQYVVGTVPQPVPEYFERSLHFYPVDIIKVIDGDTVDVDINLGVGTWLRNERIRLWGINAPELKGESRQRGLIARAELESQLGTMLDKELIAGKKVFLKTILDKKGYESHGKYGRLLGEFYTKRTVIESDTQPARTYVRNVNDWMVDNGHAVRAMYSQSDVLKRYSF